MKSRRSGMPMRMHSGTCKRLHQVTMKRSCKSSSVLPRNGSRPRNRTVLVVSMLSGSPQYEVTARRCNYVSLQLQCNASLLMSLVSPRPTGRQYCVLTRCRGRLYQPTKTGSRARFFTCFLGKTGHCQGIWLGLEAKSL